MKHGVFPTEHDIRPGCPSLTTVFSINTGSQNRHKAVISLVSGQKNKSGTKGTQFSCLTDDMGGGGNI